MCFIFKISVIILKKMNTFFIGGLQDFEFLTIHNLSTKENYESFIRPMNMFEEMIVGYPYAIHAIRDIDVECLSVLISNEMNKNIFNPKCKNIPPYILKLFNNFTNNIHKIQINMESMSYHLEYAQEEDWGYLLLKPLFFVLDNDKNLETINFGKLVKIFTNKLQKIIIFNEVDGFEESIYLNDLFLREIISGIEIINNSGLQFSAITQLIFIQNKQCIYVFGETGYKLYKYLIKHKQWS
eukprot:1233_1